MVNCMKPHLSICALHGVLFFFEYGHHWQRAKAREVPTSSISAWEIYLFPDISCVVTLSPVSYVPCLGLGGWGEAGGGGFE